MFAHGRLNTLFGSMTRSRRRGTILLLVLGALAMVLILTVVYAALGKGDRSTGRAVNDQRDAREVVDRFAVHLATVVGDDVWDTVPDFAEQRLLDLNPQLIPVYRAEVWDAAVSDFSKRSVPSLDPDFGTASLAELSLTQFRPTGAHEALIPWPEGGDLGSFFPIDPRTASDPWLASTRPTDFGVGSKSDDLLGGSYANAPFYARALDWTQISNVAPDGRFVNLYWLRDDADENGGSGFQVASLDLTRDPGSNESRLILFNEDGEAVEFGDTGYVLGLADVEDYDGDLINDSANVDPDWNVPAHWTMYQRNMARTIAELSREGFNTSDPSQPTYWEYSYADADGDGMIDSRWFELVDASSGFEVPLLGETGRRYFAAVRVIDLSSLANVNVATDQIASPTTESRIGQGPHEISLFTLLTLNMHSQAVTGIGDELYYADVFVGEGRDDYASLEDDQHVAQGRKAYLRLRQSILDWRPVPYGEVPGEENAAADWSSDLTDYSPFVVGARGREGQREDHSLFGSAVVGFAGGGNARTGPFGVSDLIELLTHHGGNDPEVFTALEQAMTASNAGGLDSPTRSILRSDRSLAAEIGVEPSTSTAAQLSDEELNRHARKHLDIRSLLTTVSGARPIRSVSTDAGGLLTIDDRLRRFRVDELMLGDLAYEGSGTVIGGNAIRPQNLARNPLIENGFAVYLSFLAPHLGEYPDGTAWPAPAGAASLADNARTLFYGHAGPEVALRIAAHMAVNFRDSADRPFVDISPADGVPDAGRIEDQIDVEIASEYAERRDEPSKALLWLVQQSERDESNLIPLLDADGDGDIQQDDIAILDADSVFGTGASSVLAQVADPTGRIASSLQPQSTDAMIIYGVEAQPFLSEVFYFNAYWDAPRAPVRDTSSLPNVGAWEATGGTDDPDSDYLIENETSGEYIIEPTLDPFDLVNPLGAAEAVRGVVNIDGEVVSGNRDFLFQVVTFQVFNPFDVPVSLRDFYFEFGGSVYRPEAPTGSLEELLLNPGETRLLYATNPGLDLSGNARTRHNPISARLDAVLSQAASLQAGVGSFTYPTFGGRLPSAVVRQSIENIVPDPERIPLRRFEVEGTVPSSADLDLLAGSPGSNDPRNRNVLMWWDLGDKFGSVGTPDWRRDDLLADRLTDSTDPADPPALDQRLDLPTSEEILPTSLMTRAGYSVEDAFIGAPINGSNVIAFAENGSINTRNLNNDGQRTVGLWGRIRRFDTSANDTGAGGRRANDLPNPSGAIPVDPTTPPPGANVADGDAGVLGVPVGALPAAALESSENRSSTVDDLFVASAPFRPTELDFDRSFTVSRGVITTVQSYETALTIEEFFVDKLLNTAEFQENRLPSLLFGVMDAFARYTFSAGAPPTPAYVDYEDIAFDSMAGTGVSTRIEPYSGSNLIQVPLNGKEFRSRIDGVPQLRVGDLLNVLAVGPYRMPLRDPAGTADGYPSASANGVARAHAYTEQWTTLGEVLGFTESVLNDLEPRGWDDEFENLAGALDRGQLKLDDFVPYFDADPSDGAFNAGLDRVRGLGVPLALGVFEVAQAGGELPDRAYGSATSPVAGLVNINTAPPSVLRLLPGLYQDVPISGAADNERPSWISRLDETATGLNVANGNALIPGSSFTDATALSGTGGDERIDVASSLLSYREPAAGYHRALRTRRLLVGGGLDVPLNMLPTAVLDDSGNPDLTRGVEILRAGNGGPEIEGLRTQPGFGSIGELLAVRPSGTAANRFDGQRFQYGMDWVARDNRTVGQLFIDSMTGVPVDPPTSPNGQFAADARLVSLDGQLLGDPLRYNEDINDAAVFQLPVTDQIPDDYDEQLVQINMLANAVSTHSDYYAAWMVVHGFADDDVEDLDENQPMRPSFRARYLMILDRSSIVRKGDLPRVLAYLRVPYDEPVRNPVYQPE